MPKTILPTICFDWFSELKGLASSFSMLETVREITLVFYKLCQQQFYEGSV